jgi:hypothetical protein
MTEEDLRPLLIPFGLYPEDSQPISKPRLSKDQRRQLAKVRRRYRSELDNAREMRAAVLNLTAGRARLQIVSELVAEGHNEAALLLTFNNDQLALLMAWRDARLVQGASSKPARKSGRRRTSAVSAEPSTPSVQGASSNAPAEPGA